MTINRRRYKESPQRLLEHLCINAKQGGPQGRTNVQLYLRMCLKAEELREQGWQATVRGEQHRWFVVVEGNQGSEKASWSRPHARVRVRNPQRGLSCIITKGPHVRVSSVVTPVVTFSIWHR